MKRTDSFVVYTIIVIYLTWLYFLPSIGFLYLIGMLR